MSNRAVSDHQDQKDYDSDGSSPSNTFLESKLKQVLAQPNPQLSFYREYCRLYINNISLLSQIKKTQESNRQLQLKLMNTVRPQSTHQHHNPEDIQSTEEKKKRMRRTAGQIARHYVCTYDKCQKSYGSEGSLNQHIKLKHSSTANH